MISLTKKFSFSCAHRIVNHPGKCKNLHGHNFNLIIEVRDNRDYYNILSNEYPILFDFGDAKRLYGKWIEDNWDHSIILWKEDKELLDFFINLKIDGKLGQKIYVMDANVTSESLAKEFLDRFPSINSVTIEEGNTSSVTVTK